MLKFGGTSVADYEAMRSVAEIVADRRQKQTLVVASAIGGATDLLMGISKAVTKQDRAGLDTALARLRARHLQIASDICSVFPMTKSGQQQFDDLIKELQRHALNCFDAGEMSPAALDRLLSFGELLSTTLLAEVCRLQGLPAVFFDVRQVLKTDERHNNAQPDLTAISKCASQRLLPLLQEGQVCITQGFIGSNASGDTTTLGRGGSDYSATLLGTALNADVIEIWTDVDGVMSADPRIVHNPKPIPLLSFDEAAELAYFGAKILHPSSLIPAIGKSIPVVVRNTRNPEHRGTTILPRNPAPNPSGVCSISFKRNITVINITSTRMLMAYGFLSKVFEVFNRYRTSVDMISTSEVSVSMTIDDLSCLDEICEALSGYGKIDVVREQCIVCLVGQGLGQLPGIAARVFSSIPDVNLGIISHCLDRDNLGFTIPEAYLEDVVQRLHQQFFADVEVTV